MRSFGARRVAVCALCVALMAVSCFFTVPLGPVPFTLQTLVVTLIALILGPAAALLCMCVYLLMGAVGLPVFSSMTGGLAKLLGPTGGFLFAFPLCAAGGSLVRRAIAGPTARAGRLQMCGDVAAAVVVMAISYALGCAWYVWVADASWAAAFAGCVAPFIPTGVGKAAVAIVIAMALRRAGVVEG